MVYQKERDRVFYIAKHEESISRSPSKDFVETSLKILKNVDH